MGNAATACFEAEDKGMKDVGMGATNASIDAISDGQLAAMSMDANAGLKQTIILNLSCQGLPNLDRASKSDTFAVLWFLKGAKNTKVKLGQTECIPDTCDPVFVQSIETEFFFEAQQRFLVEIYDADDATQLNNLAAQQFVGGYQFTMHKVVTARNQELVAELENPARAKNGTVKIKGQEKKQNYG